MAYPSKDARNRDMVKKFLNNWSLRELGGYFGIHHETARERLERWLPVYGPSFPALWKKYQERQKAVVSGVVDS